MMSPQRGWFFLTSAVRCNFSLIKMASNKQLAVFKSAKWLGSPFARITVPRFSDEVAKF